MTKFYIVREPNGDIVPFTLSNNPDKCTAMIESEWPGLGMSWIDLRDEGYVVKEVRLSFADNMIEYK